MSGQSHRICKGCTVLLEAHRFDRQHNGQYNPRCRECLGLYWENLAKASADKAVREKQKEERRKVRAERRQSGSKKCPRCTAVLLVERFGRQGEGKWRSWCRECEKTYHQEKRHKYLPTKRKSGKLQRSVVRAEVLCHYSGSPSPMCACCGESNLEFLALDHKYGGGQRHKKQVKGKVYEWAKKEGFPPMFRVLCHNCNQSLGAYGYCPHAKEKVTTEAANTQP